MTDPYAAPSGDQPTTPVYAAPTSPPPPYVAPPPYGAPLYGTPTTVGARNGFGTAALILGILSLLLFWTVLGGIVLGAVGLVLGILGRGRAKRQQATNGGAALAGIICGGIGLALGIAMVVAIVAFFQSDTGQRYLDCMDAAGSDSVATQHCTDQLRNDLTG